MRILIAHNRYQQSGGEDNVASAEAELLASRGHGIERLDVDNDQIQGVRSRMAAAAHSLYSLPGKTRMAAAITRFRPDIVHVHNFFPTLSPSVFHACADAGVPVVHTLHNYRIVCAGATLFRDGGICEACIAKRSPVPGIAHACYRGSRVGSAVAGLGMALHEHLGTWAEKVSGFIALTDFAAGKLGSYRLPREKIFVKPNFTADHGMGFADGDYALFAGRLSPEKGVQTLIEADQAGLLPMDVVVVGDGPLMGELTVAAGRPGSRLKLQGRQSHDEILQWMRHAQVLLLPSLWYEGLPLVLIEAFSFGLPVIGTDHGNLAGLLESGRTGLLYPPGDFRALGRALAWYQAHPEVVETMRVQARACYLEKYTPEANYHALLAIYSNVTRANLTLPATR